MALATWSWTVAGSDSSSVTIPSASRIGRVARPPAVCQGSGSPRWPRSLISISRGILYSWASDTMPLTDWSRPWFCISMADRRPARWAPAEIPIPSSSLASRTRIIPGSSSARRMRWTSQVSGRAETTSTPTAASAS